MSEAKVQELLADEREAADEAHAREAEKVELQAALAQQTQANEELVATLRDTLALRPT